MPINNQTRFDGEKQGSNITVFKENPTHFGKETLGYNSTMSTYDHKSFDGRQQGTNALKKHYFVFRVEKRYKNDALIILVSVF